MATVPLTLHSDLLLSILRGEVTTMRVPVDFVDVGDTIWIQERWRPGAWFNAEKVAVDYEASPELNRTPWKYNVPDAAQKFAEWDDELVRLVAEHTPEALGVTFRIDPTDDYEFRWEHGKCPLPFRAPQTMERWASRLTLHVVAVGEVWDREWIVFPGELSNQTLEFSPPIRRVTFTVESTL